MKNGRMTGEKVDVHKDFFSVYLYETESRKFHYYIFISSLIIMEKTTSETGTLCRLGVSTSVLVYSQRRFKGLEARDKRPSLVVSCRLTFCTFIPYRIKRSIVNIIFLILSKSGMGI